MQGCASVCTQARLVGLVQRNSPWPAVCPSNPGARSGGDWTVSINGEPEGGSGLVGGLLSFPFDL